MQSAVDGNNGQRAESRSETNDGSSSPVSLQPPKSKSSKDSEREKRTYRACLHCRQRKSRCDLYSSGDPGKPPCERCIREQHECVLGGSRRGGRRVKRSQSDALAGAAQHPNADTVFQPVPIHLPPPNYHNSINSEPRLPSWNSFNPESRALPPVPQEPRIHSGSPAGTKMTVDDTVASADLQNPSDALDFLANVAERAEGNQLPPMHSSVYGRHSHLMSGTSDQPHGTSQSAEHAAPNGNLIRYPPLNKGHLTIDTMKTLLIRQVTTNCIASLQSLMLQPSFEERYHPFFPLANPAAMDPNNIRTSAAEEPHLLAAILTVASKDERDWWQIHEACSEHMQQLIASLVYCGGGSVEAVEALLILAEWVPRRPSSTPAIGRGEEDHAAWMHVGTAIRLGYLLGLDRTGFRSENDALSDEINRKRLAWAACYMSDRQISVRIGKAFWSRGPGPMTALRAQDFPSLRFNRGDDYAGYNRNDDFAAIFQANLELTQLFSNAHDVLYATKNRSNQLNAGGEYVKYIDDFRVAIRTWNSLWGSLTCSGPLKASLILSYEYLRLYVNAFAYQATINRMVVQAQQAAAGGPPAHRSQQAYPFTDVAATPDARFIYDAIDAAKALLSTFNSFVDPVNCFRFMPLRYYLYVIYSATFLYKARSTGVMGGDTRGSVRRMINDTVEKLQQASACPNDVGDRYSRLIRLLWRRPPKVPNGADITRPSTAHAQTSGSTSAGTEQPGLDMQHNPTSINAFSWLDLGAVGDFATNNNSISGSLMDGIDRFEESSADGYSNWDHNMLDTQQLAWQGISPPGVIF